MKVRLKTGCTWSISVVVACIWIFAIVYVRKKYIEFNQFLCLQIKLNQPENAPRGRMLMSQNLPKKKPSESEEKSELEDIAGKSLDDLMEKEGIEKPDNKLFCNHLLFFFIIFTIFYSIHCSI